MKYVAALLALLALAPIPSTAQPPDPIALWLADDDATALPSLAERAASGDAAARMLLARIDLDPPLHSPWLLERDRGTRIALMRAPGGVSGQSWMESAGTPLASLWLELASPDSDFENALAFARAGESRAARQSLLAVAAREKHGFAEAADDPAYPPELRRLVWTEWERTPDGAARVAAEIAALPPGDPQVESFTGAAPDPADRDAWLATAGLAAPLRAFCEATCPQTPPACLRATYHLVGGERGLLTLGSPVESLIPAEIFNASPRGRAAILRQAAARAPASGPYLQAETSRLDACAGAALAAEVARFSE